MIIDMHSHFWPLKYRPPKSKSCLDICSSMAPFDIDANKLYEKMDQNDIKLSIVLSCLVGTGFPNDEYVECNDYHIEQANSIPGAFLTFCTANVEDIPFSLNEIRRCIEEKGCKGLKLHPNSQKFFPNEERLYPIYELMQEYQLPITFHTGGIGAKLYLDEYGLPKYFDEVACKFPDLPIIMGHAGRGYYNETAQILRKYPNVYADISANIARLPGQEHLLLKRLLQEVKLWTGSVDKLFFGSDFPVYSQAYTAILLNRCKDEEDEISITEEDLKKIKSENAINFLKKYKMIDQDRSFE